MQSRWAEGGSDNSWCGMCEEEVVEVLGQETWKQGDSSCPGAKVVMGEVGLDW